MRGKRAGKREQRKTSGITPAGAGKTIQRSIKSPPEQDHPRRCGENEQGSGNSVKQAGSPPQVRGKRTRRNDGRGNSGITPAGAGKTHCKTAEKARLQDHPRRCGENASRRREGACNLGSPPQVRGKPKWTDARGLEKRITPAGAGKTHCKTAEKARLQDHPRRCGENVISPPSPWTFLGSPPQVRGKPELFDGMTEEAGITPAGAGKTYYLSLRAAEI